MIPKYIMLCVENVDGARGPIEAAGALARRFQSRLLLYHASLPPAGSRHGAHLANPHVFDEIIAGAALVGVEVTTHHSQPSVGVVEDILAVADARRVDWIVMTTHARTGFDRLRFGSVTERLIRSCRLPVLTFDLGLEWLPVAGTLFDRVIVPIDFSPITEKALARGREIADCLRCGLTLVHAVEDHYTAAYPLLDMPFVATFGPGVARKAGEDLVRLAAAHGGPSPAELVTEIGSVAGIMREVVAKHRLPLVVMATAGRDSIDDWILGSRAERMLRTLHCSILALPKTALAGKEGAAVAN